MLLLYNQKLEASIIIATQQVKVKELGFIKVEAI